MVQNMVCILLVEFNSFAYILCYFCETKNKFVPRSVIIDTDPRTQDCVQSGPLGHLFDQDSFISGLYSTGWRLRFLTLLKVATSLKG